MASPIVAICTTGVTGCKQCQSSLKACGFRCLMPDMLKSRSSNRPHTAVFLHHHQEVSVSNLSCCRVPQMATVCLQDASCVSLHARNMSFSSITARLLGSNWVQQQQQQQQQRTATGVCLCGAAPECLTDVCGRLFRARPGMCGVQLTFEPAVIWATGPVTCLCCVGM